MATAVVRFQVLGSLEAVRDGTLVAIGSQRQRTLLAALLTRAGDVVSTDALTDALWGDDPPADPRNAIQTYVARLREALGPGAPLVTRSPGYALEVGPDQVDALRFDRLLAEACRRRDEPQATKRLLDEALGLWEGPAYAEFADGLARAEALRLTEDRLVALEERAAARLLLGEAASLVGELEALAADHPLRERFAELRMRALAAVGRHADALAVYRGYRQRLADETGLEPAEPIRDLEGRILRGEHASEASPQPAQEGRDPVASPAAVPGTASSLVGRGREIADVRGALRRHRVVTLTGPGGVGKTRMALEVVGGATGDQHGDVAWVGLDTVTDPAAVDHVVGAAVGADLGGGGPPQAALLGALATRRLLLVVDNCEHLLDTVAPLVDELRRGCPGVRVLATSRERLAVDGEWVVPVSPLPVSADASPGGAADAVRLFVERAGAAGAGADVGAQEPLVAEICRELDGIPLAIELAAGRAGAVPLGDLLAALREGAPGAVGRRRGSPARQRDLSAVVDWSYQLLEPEQRRLFERLGVFAGAFGAEEAHAVCAVEGQTRAVVIEQLAALAERSLVAGALTDPAGRRGRYRMLRPVRAFARERLAERGEADVIADRHAAALTEGAERAVGPPMTEEGRRWLEVSLDDLRQARLRARLTGDAALLGRLVAALYRFDYWRSGAELLGWGDDALAVSGVEEQATAPQVHAAAAAAAWMAGDLERARRLAARGAQLGSGPDDPARALAFEACGDTAAFEGRLDDAETAFTEQVRLARLGGDADVEALGRASLALVRSYAGRAAEAIAEAGAAGRAAAGAGVIAQAFVRYVQGECRADSAPDEAVALAEEAAGLARQCGAGFIEGVARLTAASLRGRHGDPADALPDFADLLRRWRRSGNWTQQWTTLRNLAELLARMGADEVAVVIASAADAEETAAPTFGPESERLARALAAAHERLGAERAEAARKRGLRMGRDAVVELALSVAGDPSGVATPAAHR